MRSRFHKRVNNSKSDNNLFFIVKIAFAILLYFILFFGIRNITSKLIAFGKFEDDIDSFNQKNSEKIFDIKEITLYSSATAKESEQSRNLGLNISRLY